MIYWIALGLSAILLWFYKGRALLDLVYNGIVFWLNMWQVKTNLIVDKVKFGSHRKQYFLVCTSLEKKARRAPVIVYWHGGGWQFGRPDGFIPTAQLFVNQGFDVILPSHRKLPFYQSVALKEDVFLTIKRVFEVMDEKGWGHRPILFGGMSSGGNLAALGVFDKEQWLKNKLPYHRIKGLFLQAAPVDINQMSPTPPIWMYAGWRHKSRWKKANPMEYLTTPFELPLLLSHGDADDIVELASSQSFYEKAKTLNQSTTQLDIYKGITHIQASMWYFREDAMQKAILKWLNQF